MSKDKSGQWWDVSLNPWENCTPISEACASCYALSLIKRFRGWEPGDIHYFPERIEKARVWRKHRHIFVCSLSDILHEKVDPIEIVSALAFVRWLTVSCQHTCYILTKRPPRFGPIHDLMMRHGLSPHFNLKERVGITAENQNRLKERWRFLNQIPAKFKWLSLEPLLGPLDLSGVIEHVDWIVVGSETGPKRRPCKMEWIESIVEQCKAAGVPVWVKQTELGKDMNMWPEHIRLRERP